MPHEFGRRLIGLVVLLYPPGFRCSHGPEVEDGLIDALSESSRTRWFRHLLSVAGHAVGTRGQWATGGRRSETIRQGFVLAVVVTLAAAIADANGWGGWPYVFATALLLAGTWGLMLRRGRLVSLIAGALLLPAGKEFYDPYGITVPFLGEFSVGIVVLALLLGFTPTSLAPSRYLSTIAGIGLVHTFLGSPYSTMKYLVPALMVVGLLLALLDARAAVAVTITPLLVAITRFEWRVFGPSSGPLAALSILAAVALIVRLRRHPSGGAQPG